MSACPTANETLLEWSREEVAALRREVASARAHIARLEGELRSERVRAEVAEKSRDEWERMWRAT